MLFAHVDLNQDEVDQIHDFVQKHVLAMEDNGTAWTDDGKESTPGYKLMSKLQNIFYPYISDVGGIKKTPDRIFPKVRA